MNGRIVYVAAFFPKLSETFVYREVLGLRQAGVEVSVVSVRPSEDDMGEQELNALKADVIPVYGTGAGWMGTAFAELLRHPLRSLKTMSQAKWEGFTSRDVQGMNARLKVGVQAFASLALAHRLRPLHPVLLHAHMAHVPASIARYTARQLGIPFSFTGHAADIFRDRLLLEPKLKEAAFVHCISEWHRTFYQEIAPRPEEEYPVIRCGVDPDSFPPASTVASAPVRIFAVGRLVRKKGFDLLLEALKDQVLLALDWELMLIGDGPERENLQAQWAAHPAKERVTLAGGKPNHVVREEMSRADIFVLPCRVDLEGDRDGIPVVLMEAMAAGATVISGDVPSIRELIQDGENGRMIPSEDVPALVRALQEVLADESLRNARIAKGRKRIEEEFSLATAVERIVKNLQTRNLVTS